MKSKMQGAGNTSCCEIMRSQMNWKCEQHTDPIDCPDALIGRVGKNKTLGLLIHDGGSSFIPINYCPWCGARQLSPVS
jgi:hypothetical protein